MKTYRKERWFLFVTLIITSLVRGVSAETIYVDSINGNDTNAGTKEMAIKTLQQAATIVNRNKEPGPTTIKIAPGIYNITKCVVFNNARPYTEKDRLIIEAAILPDEPNWNPAFMPVILSTQNPKDPNKPDRHTETHSLKVKTSHVTIRGLKFLGNPLVNNWHACIAQEGGNLDDLIITQCMFIGDRNSLDIYVGVIGISDRMIIDHCIFYKCHASVVFWDGLEGIGGKNCAMRNCIVRDGYISGVWTCQTDEDFDFQNNIITGCEYFWIRKQADEQKYKITNCIITGNKFYSGYGVASGAIGQTGKEVVYNEENVVKTGEVVPQRDKKARNYLHVVDGGLGSELGAGLFKK